MSATCLITFRASDAARARNLRFVLQWLDVLPGLETLVVEQDRAPTLDAASLPGSCRTLFVPNAGPFNKSWGLNVGFHVAEGEVLVVSDADVVVHGDRISHALDACRSDYELIRPWSDIVDLTEEETAALVAGHLDEAAVAVPGRRGRRRVGEEPPLCGGVYVIRRDVYERLGGQDERFFGWGGEDDAMSLKVAALCTRVGMLRDSLAVHLHHPRHAALPVDDPAYRRNVELLAGYRKLSREKIAKMCSTARGTMGDASRFDEAGQGA